MKNYSNENKNLKLKIQNLQKIIKQKNKLLDDYKNNWSINLFNSLQAITDEYSILLNPPVVKLKASYKNKSEAYNIKIENVIGIFSEGRTKKILLESSISGIGNNVRNTDLICVESSWESIIQKLDRVKFHLCEIDKSTFLNIKYYDLTNDELTFSINKSKFPEYKKFELKGDYKNNFILMKENYNRIYWLQKVFVDYKLKNGFPI